MPYGQEASSERNTEITSTHCSSLANEREFLISLAFWPLTQFASRAFALSFLKQKIKLASRRIVLDLRVPCGVVLFRDKGRQFGHFSRRKLTHCSLDLGQAHVAICRPARIKQYPSLPDHLARCDARAALNPPANLALIVGSFDEWETGAEA